MVSSALRWGPLSTGLSPGPHGCVRWSWQGCLGNFPANRSPKGKVLCGAAGTPVSRLREAKERGNFLPVIYSWTRSQLLALELEELRRKQGRPGGGTYLPEPGVSKGESDAHGYSWQQRASQACGVRGQRRGHRLRGVGLLGSSPGRQPPGGSSWCPLLLTETGQESSEVGSSEGKAGFPRGSRPGLCLPPACAYSSLQSTGCLRPEC